MELAILIGLQASGKTHFYQTFLGQTHIHISKDRMRSARSKQERQERLIEEMLQKGVSVAVDNTNPSRHVREALIKLGKQYGAEIIGYYFEPNIQESLRRNRQRSVKECVPDVAIFTSAKQLEKPLEEEGFDHCFQVELSGSGEFKMVYLF